MVGSQCLEALHGVEDMLFLTKQEIISDILAKCVFAIIVKKKTFSSNFIPKSSS